jgi:hypothetical protein
LKPVKSNCWTCGRRRSFRRDISPRPESVPGKAAPRD